ncbi:MAG TPA: hypothetical protein VLK32_00255 [Bacillota bacterium]|nr:hypothetical protein [Bacillota bacterium]
MNKRSFELSGLDGASPLGFLATLGTLVALEQAANCGVRVRWAKRHTWIPVLEDVSSFDEDGVAGVIAEAVRGRKVSPDAEASRDAAGRTWRSAKDYLKKKRADIKGQRLSRAERAEIWDREVRPAEEQERSKRQAYIQALQDAVPRAELALGNRINDGTRDDYRRLAERLLYAGDHFNRDELDLLVALGNDACVDKQMLEPTPFQFTRGSGHQNFLGDVRQLLAEVTTKRVREVLFQPWTYRDEGLSLRWDPFEDRRYALLAQDPSDEGARTVWMGNVLAYRGLGLFSTVPARGGLAAAGWSYQKDQFSWPIWEFPATLDMVRTLVQLREVTDQNPDGRALGGRGIVAVYRAQRITVGSGANTKVNFTPARQVLGTRGVMVLTQT